MDVWRLAAFFAYSIGAALLIRWLSGAIAVKLGRPRAEGWRAAQTGGLSLIMRPLTAEELAAKAAAKQAQPVGRSSR